MTDRFEIQLFETAFDFAIAQSLFTHLRANQVLRCLVRTREVLVPIGRLQATYFEAPFPGHVDSIVHDPGGIRTGLDSDPYHYSAEEARSLARFAGLEAERIGAWAHPRGQRAMVFRRA